jgi:hypothetical protein
VKKIPAVAGLVAAAILTLSIPLLAAIQLVPVVTGLSSPVFVGHAGDATNRLFIIEQAGIIKVLQPGSSSPTTFLDIRNKILFGGEQGLLGLAFHPQYASNGRFFVFYTNTAGNQVIAEYGVSGNPNVASTTETILLTIPHPSFTNHNGGMLAFGPDNYLYIGVGDGGGGNDPGNNAQDLNELLGKILRIDVDQPGVPYVSPSTNPFFGLPNHRDEIFAYGMRNPWRFSFDRLTGQQWVADVGQGAREEVDTPIVSGGNYGWRVYEGFNCTNIDPSLCGSPGFIFPVFDYNHSGGRCSITGGYVYRGAQNAVPNGTYIYGDYCSGEIFGWDGSTQSLLLDTTLNISSFGEDESGELYVVNLNGSISRIASTTPSCTYSIAPTSVNVGAGAATGTVMVTAGAGCAWTAVPNASWLHITSGSTGSGNGSAGYSVDANTSSTPRSGTLTVAGHTFTVNQAGATPPSCTYALQPTSMNVGSGAVTNDFHVVTQAGCAWTAVSNAPWIQVVHPPQGSGSGNGPVVFSAQANTSTPRSGTITVAGLTFTINQAGTTPPPCTYSINPASVNVGASATTGSVMVTAGAGCGWTAVPNASWLHITSGASGSGNGSTGYSVDANTSSTPRSGTLTIAGRTFTVNQAGTTPPSCTYSIQPTSMNIGRGSVTNDFHVVTQAGCAWTAVSNAPWIQVIFPSNGSGSGNGPVVFTAQANTTGSARSGTISVAGRTFTINQAQ